MAAPRSSGTLRKRKRYWEAEEEPAGDAAASGKGRPAEQVKVGRRKPGARRPEKGKRMDRQASRHPPKKVLSGREDPFPGPAPIPKEVMRKFQRGTSIKVGEIANQKVKNQLKILEKLSKQAEKQAARFDLLLPEEAGFLEADEGEDTCFIQQRDIADVVDISSASKFFNLELSQFGPYRINYSRNGRHLLLAGRRGHVAALDWHTKQLLCETNVMEDVNDIRWLHTETMFAVAQKKWLYIYDNQAVELHCVKKFNDVLRMEFLPYHFLLATCNSRGFLQYLDVSVGKEVTAICTKAGRLDVMTQNPYNAIIHLGHPQGTVSLWSPNSKEPLVKMLCHRGGVRAIAIDRTGTGGCHLAFSQRDLLAVGTGNTLNVYKDIHHATVSKPYLTHTLPQGVHGLQFCPFEDVLGVGHGRGFSSLLVPGAGEANFDGLECNPYRSKKQRQEWEVKALLEKIQPDLINLDPTKLGKIDFITMNQKNQERIQRLGFDPSQKEKFQPKRKMKGRSSAKSIERRKRKVTVAEQRETIRQSVQEKQETVRERQKVVKGRLSHSKGSALDRFHK
ncbi:WD repeat-containing protein 46 isoform X2 [Stegostoma tigrinum]|uniref:WD repeat-containing protein 46 isoform X2 n=1 Tax=Stegostoma tigrinum TaxID=3053191 RepID=UPI002870926F|nr:WD repeat-containing protein 46 isoform X2 [Stegostoma tigrinum]